MDNPRQKARDKLVEGLVIGARLPIDMCEKLASDIVTCIVGATMQELRAKWQRKGAQALEGEDDETS
jgi:hypothetical protein